jgi:iron complex outermembrane receptor protein
VGYTFSKDASATGIRRWMGGLRLTVGVNNIMDDMPPVSPQAFNESNADVSSYSPIGRLWFIKADYKF